MNPIDSQIGVNLQRERARQLLSLNELALLTHIASARLESFESGAARMTAPELFALSTVLKVPIAAFFAFNANDNDRSP